MPQSKRHGTQAILYVQATGANKKDSIMSENDKIDDYERDMREQEWDGWDDDIEDDSEDGILNDGDVDPAFTSRREANGMFFMKDLF